MTSTPLPLFERLVQELGYRESGGLVSTDQPVRSGNRRMVAERVRRHLPEVDAIYFAEDVPLVYLSAREQIDAASVTRLHRNAWNDSRVPLLVVVDAAHIKVYDTWAEPTLDASNLDSDDRLIAQLSAVDDLLKKAPFLHRSRLDTGGYARDLPHRFKLTTRCDRSLLDNLLATQERLLDEDLPHDVVHLLLIRSIFLRHLEDRGILGPELFSQYVKDAAHLPDVYQNRDATYRLFADLAERFDGDLFPVSEREQVVDDRHTGLLSRFLRGEEDLKSGQPTLWPLYDFSIIPIQLISSAYQELLHAKDPEGAREAGVYYTRHPVVELMLNEVLPWPGPDEPESRGLPSVVDPSCGSGVFLVEAFRRLVSRWRYDNPKTKPSVDNLTRLLTSKVHGVDENGDAIRISAFSLCLALLDEIESETIWSELRFPTLLSGSDGRPANLIEGNAFPPSATFDVVVGNPPWRRGKLPTVAKAWCDKKQYPVAGEIAQAFMWLCRDLAPAGKVALLTPTKWLLNRESLDAKFRRTFFSQNHVRTMINLSAFVGGENRLFSASASATVVVFEPTRPARPSPSILYCTPRPGAQERSPIPLLIDAADLKWIAREEAESHTDVWKALYVGSRRDLRLVRRLTNPAATLARFLRAQKQRGWVAARGFQAPGPRRAARITKIPFVDAADVYRFQLLPALHRMNWPKNGFKRTGPLKIYKAPHILLKEGVIVQWLQSSSEGAGSPARCAAMARVR